MIDVLTIVAVLAAAVIFATALVALTRWAWNWFWTAISRHISTHVDRALGPETNEQRYAALEREHQALLLAEHNKDQ